MNAKFKNVPIDNEIRILFSKEEKIGDLEVLHEGWDWGGIRAESIIFANEDVADLEEEQIKEIARDSPLFLPGSGITFSRVESGFTFVNCNFQTE